MELGGITSDCIGLKGTISYQPKLLGAAQVLGIRGRGTSTVAQTTTRV